MPPRIDPRRLSEEDRRGLLHRLYAAFKADMPRNFIPGTAHLCPFCAASGWARVYVTGMLRGAIGVVHAVPLCATFETMSPSEFLAAAMTKEIV